MKKLNLIFTCASVFFLLYYTITGFSETTVKLDLSISYYVVLLSSTAILSVAISAFVSYPWAKIVELRSGKKCLTKLIAIWYKSNLYRYLPGNIFHYTARQVYGAKLGISRKSLMSSSAIELVLIAFCSLIVSLFSWLLFSFEDIFVFAIGFSILTILVFFKKRYGSYYIILLSYAGYFLSSTVIVYIINYFLIPSTVTFNQLLFAYPLSWLIGVVTPGAPGGIGTREVSFVYLTSSFYSASDATIIVSLSRLVFLLSEVIVYTLIYLFFSHLTDFSDSENLES